MIIQFGIIINIRTELQFASKNKSNRERGDNEQMDPTVNNQNGGQAPRGAQLEHIRHASLFSREHISFSSSCLRWRCLSSARANSGSFSAAMSAVLFSVARVISSDIVIEIDFDMPLADTTELAADFGVTASAEVV